MGLKGYRLWVMGQLDSTCRAPPRGRAGERGVNRPERGARQHVTRDAAAQVEFGRKGLKPVYHVIGARVETTWVPGAFQLRVRGSQRAPPRRDPRHEAHSPRQVGAAGVVHRLVVVHAGQRGVAVHVDPFESKF
jgi:hypothetical protein